MSKKSFWFIFSGLILAALSISAYKVLYLNFPVFPDDQTFLWDIEARVSFTQKETSGSLTLLLPKSSKNSVILDENFVSNGNSLTLDNSTQNRKAIWDFKKNPAKQVFFYRALLKHERNTNETSLKNFKIPDVGQTNFEGGQLAAAKLVIEELRAGGKSREEIITALLRDIFSQQRPKNLQLLMAKKSSSAQKVELACQILALDNIIARSVHGVRLEKNSRNAKVIHWIEVLDTEKKEWLAYEPFSEKAGIGIDTLTWWKGDTTLTNIDDSTAEYAISIRRNFESTINFMSRSANDSDSVFIRYSLLSLPIEQQNIYGILLLIPIGALLVVLMRNIIGLKTFGTFMPVLLAIAFRETGLLWGVLFLTLIVMMGLVIRAYLAKLRLLLVPRLAAVLSIVVIIMAAISIFCHKNGIEVGLSLSLFPMIIMTMMIERITVVSEEQGFTAAVKQGIASIFSASLTYFVITTRNIEHLVFIFPELLLIVVALNLLLGRYTGYRLLELSRFKSLYESEQK